MTMSTLEVLTTARALIADADHWTSGWFFADALGQYMRGGRHYRWNDDPVCRFCADGALIAATKDDDLLLLDAREVLLPLAVHVMKVNKVNSETPMDPLIFVNDHLGHTATLELFDLAITRLETGRNGHSRLYAGGDETRQVGST